jgi:hypothetical protein
MGYIGNGPYQGVLTGGNIQDGTVETTDLADGAVTTVKINDGAVTAAKLAAGAIPDATSLEDSGGTTRVQATTSGVDVTGTVTADGLTVDGVSNLNGTVGVNNTSGYASIEVGGTSGGYVDLKAPNTDDYDLRVIHHNNSGSPYNAFDVKSGDLFIKTGVSGLDRFKVENSTGDISFYEDTGTTAKFFWDASAESLGIGTTWLDGQLHVNSSSETVASITSEDAVSAAKLQIGFFNTALGWTEGLTISKVRAFSGSAEYDVDTSGSGHVFKTQGTERMRIDSSGRVTMPYQPSFTAYGGAAQNPASIEAVIFEFTKVNVGNHYSTANSRFTAPIAGNYYFYTTFMNNTNNEYCRYGIYKNGAIYGQALFLESASYARATHGMVIALSAGDYVDVRFNINGNNEGNIHDEYRVFTGYLIG